MSPDGITLSVIVRELQELLIQGKVERIFQPEEHEIILHIRRPGQSFRLLLSAQAENARVHLTGKEKKNPPSPPLFCLVLRKYLEGSRLIRIEQVDLDRVLRLTFTRLEESGLYQEKILIVEIMGKHSNIILLEPKTGLIIDGIKRYSHAVSRHREVLPGRPYLPPPAQNKVHPLDLTEEMFRETLLKGPWEKPTSELISCHIAGIGPVLGREIAARAGLDCDLRLEYCGEHELRTLWTAFQKAVPPLLQGDYQPTLIFERKRPICYAPVALIQYQGLRAVSQKSMNQILDQYYTVRQEINRYQQLLNTLKNTVKREQERCLKKILISQQVQAEAEKALGYRLQGEMLLAHLHQIPRGQKHVVLPNLYEPEAPPVEIELNPSLTPSQNAQQLFRKYTKARNTLNFVREQMMQTAGEQKYLASVLTALDQAETLQELEEIRTELEEAGYIKAKNRKHKKGKREASNLQPQILRFTSPEGFEILVGKNNKQNDYLTMRLAKNDDLWLHAKDVAGSHVVIKAQPGRSIPPATLERAAQLAAYYSEARHSSKVPVDYTKRKNVSKPARARPGYVIYENYETVFVAPTEPERFTSSV
ncbi:MAG: NFACT RNA binding domain-containing protein [Bacillota bacterium]|nr:NFACT RNA binding domain-containing protein [Bacillota bacterium]